MLGTTEIDESASGGGGISKTLDPGKHMCTVHKVELSQYTQMAKDRNGYYVILHLEGPDMGEGFEGFNIDNETPSLGKHKGQVGKVKTYSWPYADGETKGGTKVHRDIDIMKDLKRLCIAYGCLDWLEAQNNKHETIESLVAEFNKTCPLIGKVMNFVITGREYYNKQGYKQWDLTLAPYTNDMKPYESVTVPAGDSKLIVFDEAKHMERAPEQQEQKTFAGDIDDGSGTSTGGGANVDEEFAV